LFNLYVIGFVLDETQAYRGIVVAQGGCIWAESPGLAEGATFLFILPLDPPEPTRGKHPPRREAHDRPQPRRGA
jgi:hypothetical protein